MTRFPEELEKYYENIEEDRQPDFGRAWKCTHKATKTIVHIREMYECYNSETRSFLKQLSIWLDLLPHHNLLQLYFVHKIKNFIYLAVEYMQSDLSAVVRAENKLEEIHIRYITYQILQLFKYAHSAGVIFRDLRMHLFGINDDCTVKLIEFSDMIIKGDDSEEPRDRFDADRWYRPPERFFLVQKQEQTSAYDMWALGCILAKLYTGSPLFPGNSIMSQLEKILNVLGSPTEQDLIDLPSPFTQTMLEAANVTQPVRSLKEVCPNIPEDGLDLLKKLLQWSPKNRITADEALKHKFVADFYQYDQLNRDQVCPHKITLPIDDKQLDNKQFLDETLQQMIAKLHFKLHSPLITTALIAHNIARSSDALTLFPREIWLLIFRMLDELSGTSVTMAHETKATSVFSRYFNSD